MSQHTEYLTSVCGPAELRIVPSRNGRAFDIAFIIDGGYTHLEMALEQVKHCLERLVPVSDETADLLRGEFTVDA